MTDERTTGKIINVMMAMREWQEQYERMTVEIM